MTSATLGTGVTEVTLKLYAPVISALVLLLLGLFKTFILSGVSSQHLDGPWG